MLFFILKNTEWCNGMLAYTEMLNKIWDKCRICVVITAWMLWFFLKQKVTVFVLLPSLQTLSDLELVKNCKRALCVKKGVVIKLVSWVF